MSSETESFSQFHSEICQMKSRVVRNRGFVADRSPVAFREAENSQWLWFRGARSSTSRLREGVRLGDVEDKISLKPEDT